MRKFFCIVSIGLCTIFFGCSQTQENYYGAGKAALEAGNFDKAIEYLRVARYHQPDDFSINLYLGQAFLAKKSEKDSIYRARFYLKKAKESARNNADHIKVTVTLLSVYQDQERYESVVNESKRILRENRDKLDTDTRFMIYQLLSAAYFNIERYEEASNVYNLIQKDFADRLKQDQEALLLHYLLHGTSLILADRNQKPEGVRLLTKVTENQMARCSPSIRQEAGRCYEMIGDILFKGDNYGDALQYYQFANNQFVFVNNRDRIDEMTNKIDKATRKYDKNCDLYDCHIRKGEKFFKEQDFGDAAKSFIAAVEKSTDRTQKANALYRAAIALYRDKETDEAIKKFYEYDDIINEDRKISKKITDAMRVDLYYGATLIMTAQKPSESKITKMLKQAGEKVKNLNPLGEDDTSDPNTEVTFKEQVNEGVDKVKSALKNISTESSSELKKEAAEVCSQIGDKFADWGDDFGKKAMQFYLHAKDFHDPLFDRKSIGKIQEKINELNG